MPYRTRYPRRPFSVMRKRSRYQWVRDLVNVASVTSPLNIDLMSDWRSNMNLTLLLPDIVIWRFRIRLSITGKIAVASSAKASNGVEVSSYVNALDSTPVVLSNAKYEQQFLIFDQIYCSEMFSQSANNFNAVTTNEIYLFKDYEIKSHRKFPNQNDTLWLHIGNVGDFVMDQVNYTMRLLIKLP
jgi:hypothetical protein